MSQVGIPRPTSMGQKMGVSLPQIEHPLSRMGDPTNMDIRGVSRAGDRPLSHPSGRPLANENIYSTRKSMSAQGRDSRLASRQMMAPLPIDSIPEGVEVTYGDPSKTRLPVFGKCFYRIKTGTCCLCSFSLLLLQYGHTISCGNHFRTFCEGFVFFCAVYCTGVECID